MSATKVKKAERRWDVFVWEHETSKLHTLIGSDRPETGSFHTVEKCLANGFERVNDAFGVVALPAGKFKVGDKLPKDAETYPV